MKKVLNFSVSLLSEMSFLKKGDRQFFHQPSPMVWVSLINSNATGSMHFALEVCYISASNAL